MADQVQGVPALQPPPPVQAGQQVQQQQQDHSTPPAHAPHVHIPAAEQGKQIVQVGPT